MGWLSGIADAGADAGKIAGKDLPGDIKPRLPESLGAPKVPDVAPMKPIEPIEPVAEPVKPKEGGSGGLVAAGGIALGGLGFILPSLLNSSAVTGAVAGAAQVGTAAVLGNDAKDVLNNLISGITSSPENMAMAAGAGVVVLFLLFRK
jgi:hypothetical protein